MKRFIIPAVAALSAVTTSTFAATVYVDGASGDDSAAGTPEAPLKTIAAGVAAAAGTDSPKTVIVRSGTYKITELIAISNGVSVVSETGDPDDVIVDGQGVTPVFQWTDWSSNGSRLEGITVCNGFYGSPNSGQPITAGVYMRGGMLTNCVVRDCLLTSGSGSGAAYGAGVKTDANRTHKIIPRIVDCHIYGNTVSNDCTTTYNTVHGGGIALIDSGGVISGCVVENNMVWFRKWNNDIGVDAATGAGISVNTRGEISDCIIRNNIATNANNNGWAGGGGGIAAGSESVVSNCLVCGNTVSCYGGGISTSSGTLITHCTVTNNSVLGPPDLVSTISGGGVSLGGEGSRCLNSLIHDNRVVCGGGSINTKSGGGAVGISGTDCLLANCSVVGNSANCGGAFFIGNILGGSGMNAVVSNCYVYGNAATVNAGVLGYYIPQNVLMTDCIVVSNSAAHAGICFGYTAGKNCGGLKFRNSWFYGNYIDGSNVNGDGMFCGQLTQTYVQPLSLEYCTIVSNFPKYRVVYPTTTTEVSNYFCRGCVFFGNRNYTSGGAVSSVSQTLAGLTNAWYNFSDSNGFDFDDPVYGNFKTAAKEDFVDFDAGRCRIAESSHMRDKGGVAEDWMLGKNSLDMGTGEMTVTPVGDYGIELTRVGAVRRLKNLPEPGCFELWYPAGTVLSIR